jgi:DUF4097 and DUF4098 domain-containing protein YvlB
MTRHEEFTTGGPAKLDVRVPAGHLEVQAGSETTTVELEPLNGDLAQEAVDDATVEQRGDRIVVKVKQPGRLRGRNVEVLVRIACPHLSDLDATTASADVRTRGQLGSVEVTTASGDVDVESAETGAKVTVASGDVELGTVAGKAEVNTASGDVRIDGLHADGRIRTASGDVLVRDALGAVDVQSASGDQRVDAIREGSVSLKSASGDLTVGVVQGSSLFLDARSMSGATESEIPLGDEPTGEETGPKVEVRAHSMSGDVKVVRA